MTDKLICLYPESGTAPLQGLYLRSDIRARAALSPLVYTNFITSLDGRIALVRPDGRHHARYGAILVALYAHLRAGHTALRRCAGFG